MEQKIIAIADKIILFGFALLLTITPLLVVPLTSELFEFNKMFFVYGVTISVAAAWIVKIIYRCQTAQNSKRKIPSQNQNRNIAAHHINGLPLRQTPLDIPILFFLLGQLAAVVFSIDPHMSVWGYYSRQNGGLLSTIAYITLFYVFVGNFGTKEKKQASARPALKRLGWLALASGLLVALYGILQHFGIDKQLWVQDVQRRVFSTLGQPNWLAAYMALLTPFALGWGMDAFVRKEGAKRRTGNVATALGLAGMGGIFYLAILYSKSRSGLLGFWVGDMVFWTLVGRDYLRRNANISRLFFGLHFALFLVTFVVGVPAAKINKWMLPGLRKQIAEKKVEQIIIKNANQGTVIGRGGTESGKIRKYVWQAAIAAWQANPLLGTGVETFAWAFYRYKPVEHNLTSEWDFLYNKAHNEYLNYAATTGIIGLGGYLLLIGTFLFRAFKAIKQQSMLLTGLLAAWITILITNFFGFAVVVTNLYFWLLPALLFVFSHEQQAHSRFSRLPSKLQTAMAVAVTAIAVWLLLLLGKYWYADLLYTQGRKLLQGEFVHQSRRKLKAATRLRQGEPQFWDELGYAEALLAVQAAERGEATRSAELTKRSLDDQGKALLISPWNLNFVKTRVRIYYLLEQVFAGKGFLALAIKTLEQGRQLAPHDPKIVYNLALLYARRSERPQAEKEKANLQQAIALLKTAIALKTDYRDGRLALGLFYQEAGKKELAKQQFEYIIKKINPEDKEAAKYLHGLQPDRS